MLQGNSLDEIIKNARSVERPEYDAMADEIVLNRTMYGDDETMKWLFIQMRLNVMMRKWREDGGESGVT